MSIEPQYPYIDRSSGQASVTLDTDAVVHCFQVGATAYAVRLHPDAEVFIVVPNDFVRSEEETDLHTAVLDRAQQMHEAGGRAAWL